MKCNNVLDALPEWFHGVLGSPVRFQCRLVLAELVVVNGNKFSAHMGENVKERVLRDALGTVNERAVILFVDTLDELSLHDVVRGLVAVKFCLVDSEMGCLCLDLRSGVVFHVGKIAWIGWFNEGDTIAGG